VVDARGGRVVGSEEECFAPAGANVLNGLAAQLGGDAAPAKQRVGGDLAESGQGRHALRMHGKAGAGQALALSAHVERAAVVGIFGAEEDLASYVREDHSIDGFPEREQLVDQLFGDGDRVSHWIHLRGILLHRLNGK